MQTVTNHRIEIAYEILNAEAAKIPICFIAGLGGTRQSVMRPAQSFSGDRPVVLHDHRGTGQSAKPLGVYSIEAMASDVIAVMDDAGIAKAHMAGFSTGGAICQVLAIDYPGRVQSVAMCCTWPKSDAFFRHQFNCRKQVLLELGTEAVMRLSSFALHDPKYFTDNYDAIVEWEDRAIAGAGPREVDAERMDAIMAHDQRDRLDQIKAPAIVMCARNDAVCPDYYSKDLAERIPGAELKLYDDGGHFFFNARADDFDTDLAAFIARHE